jgi:hypothetical protein
MARRQSIRRAARGARTIVIAHRGGRSGAAENDASTPAGADAVCYGASVLDGPCDLELTFAAGRLQTLRLAPGRSLETLLYPTGAWPALDGGFGWNGPGATGAPFIQLAGQDPFDTYSPGSVAEGALLSGSGWTGAAAVTTPFFREVGEDMFESYPVGGLAAGALADGSGWNGGAVLFPAAAT